MIGNLSPSDRIPMTPWILAHKIGHGIGDTKMYERRFNSIYKYLESLTPPVSKSNTRGSFTKLLSVVKLLTMKSARNNLLNNSDDIVSELFAQYLIQGTVKLNMDNSTESEEVINDDIKNILSSVSGKVIVEM